MITVTKSKAGDGMKTEDIIDAFKESNFRATPQRIEVYKYVYEHRTHPDAQEVYENVIEKNPSFSRTTVYNALKSLAGAGFIMPVTIDEERIHYDANTNLHGHFKCVKCSRIYDFETSLPQESGLDGFLITQKDVYYSGLCVHCVNK